MRNIFTIFSCLFLSLAANAQSNARLEEYYDVRDVDSSERYHYVIAYDKDNNRSSETVYVAKQQDDDSWGTESLYGRGIYKYEYDATGRLSVKTLDFDNDNLDSYCIMITYNDDGSTTYKKYWRYDGHTDSEASEEWTYKNDYLASYKEDNDRMRYFNEYGEEYWKHSYDEGRLRIGEKNDSTTIDYNFYNGKINIERVENYRYDPQTGHLLEYVKWDDYSDNERYVNVYDAHGRLLRFEEYSEEDDDDVVVNPAAMDASSQLTMEGIVAAMESERPQWKASDSMEYTYFGDEVYGVGNPWHDVFQFDGPVTKFQIVSEDEDENLEIQFNRDATGKLLSVVYPSVEISNEWGSFIQKGIVAVDDNGQITSVETLYKESYPPYEDINGDGVVDENDGYYYEEISKTVYTWQNGKVIQSKETTTTNGWGGEYTSSVTNTYTYGSNSFTCVCKYDETGDQETTSIVKDGGYMKITQGNEVEIHETQAETISFFRPEPQMDMSVPEPRLPITLAVEGRHWVVSTDAYSQGEYCESLIEDKDYYYHSDMDDYITIKHEGDFTVAYDTDNIPLYVLKDGRLVKEYDCYQMSSVSPATRIASNLPDDIYPCTETEYEYNADGNLITRTLRDYDGSGNLETTIVLTYKYGGSLGVESIEGTAKAGVTINGRTLGAKNGGAFCVYDLNGRAVAIGQTAVSLSTAGTYIVKIGGQTIKLNVK